MILVTGAAGFVGRHVVRALAESGRRVRALVRDVSAAERLQDLDCELAAGDVTRPGSLREAMGGVTTVVHLVAIIAGRPSAFERVMSAGTTNVLEEARAAHVEGIVFMSALGTDERTKDAVPYFAAKWASEQAVASSGLRYTILRPSFVFGGDGGILPRLLRIARLAPITPVIGDGRQRIQPVWVDDLAGVVAAAAAAPQDGIVEVGGPDVVDWNALWQLLKEAQGTRRPAIHLPTWLLRPQALVLERLPGAPLTRDQLTMLSLGDNVPSDGGAGQARLGLDAPLSLEEQLRRAVAATA